MREYRTGQGRWLSPDPAGMGAVDPTTPQTWNRYAYVGNNPLSYVDPLGLYQAAPGQCQTGSGDGCAGPPDTSWDSGFPAAIPTGAGVFQASEDSYLAWVNAIENAGGSAFTTDSGVTISITWSVTDGVYGIKNNGDVVDAAGLAELIGAGPGDGSDFPAPTTQQQAIISQARKYTLSLLKAPGCKAAYGGKGAQTVKNTRYQPVPPSFLGGAPAATGGPLFVAIDSQGPFFNFTPGATYYYHGQNGATIGLSAGPGYNSFLMLYELGHQLDSITHFPFDNNNPDAGAANVEFVYSNCLSH